MILRKLPRLLLAGILGVGLVLAATATAAQADPPTSADFNEIVAAFLTPNPPCMDDPGGSTSDGKIMQIFSCHGYASDGVPQRFYFDPLPNTSPTQYKIRVLASGLCLTLSDGATAGFKVFQSSCSRLNSNWKFLPYSFDPTHLNSIQNVNTDLCMTVGTGTSTVKSNGTLIFAEPCADPVGIGTLGTQQVWSIE
jgi:hypothetical protein